MSIHDVEGKIFCGDCKSKQTAPALASGYVNPCAESDITFLMNKAVEDAGWKHKFAPNVELSLDNMGNRMQGLSLDADVWHNKLSREHSRLIEIFPGGNWKFWSFTYGDWRCEVQGPKHLWDGNWKWINDQCSPNLKQP